MIPSITRMTIPSRRRTKPAKTPSPRPMADVTVATTRPTTSEIRVP